jgi:hypothetical protein
MKPVTLSASWDRKYIGLSLLTILLSLTTVARQLTVVSSVMIETEKLKEDFLVFRESLEKEHGCLYRYKRKMELDKLFDSSFVALDHPMTQLDFGKTIMYVISFLEDGPTGANIPTLLLNDYAEQEKLFPVLVFYQE